MDENLPQEQKIPEIPKDVQKKLEKLKDKLDSFKKKVLSKYSKEVLGIALLPPEQPPQSPEQDKKELPPGMPQPPKRNPDEIPLLIILDDSQVLQEDPKEQKENIFQYRNRLAESIDKMAVEIDQNIMPRVMLMAELREACYDSKYELLKLISLSAHIHDPKDLLAAIKICEVHKAMVLNRFDKYIVSYIAVGSLFRGDAKSNDIDVAVVIDDTDVKKMSRLELRDRLMGIIRNYGADAAAITKVKKEFHIQCYILTDFWEAVKDASPVIFTFLRDGVPLYDRGTFMPWKLLLQMGRVRPSQEAIDLHADTGFRFITRAKNRLVSVIAEDIYYAAINPMQAALMLYGFAPTTPKETIELAEEIFVKRERLLEPKYVNFLRSVRKYYKDIEHFTIKYVTGKEVDMLLKQAEDYTNRIKKLFKQIENKFANQRTQEFYNNFETILKHLLETENIPYKALKDGFTSLIKKNLISKSMESQFKHIMKLKSQKGMGKQEIEKIKRETASFVRTLDEIANRHLLLSTAKSTIKVSYSAGRKGDVVFCRDNVYFIKDSDKKEKEVHRMSFISKDQKFGQIEKSSPADLEAEIKERKTIQSLPVSDELFKRFKKAFGDDVKIVF